MEYSNSWSVPTTICCTTLRCFAIPHDMVTPDKVDYPALRSIMFNRLNMMIEQRRAALVHQRELRRDANLVELAILQHKAHMLRCRMKAIDEFVAEGFWYRDEEERSLFREDGP
eukprot:273105-Heterocapsa_arctica.AAC.1